MLRSETKTGPLKLVLQLLRAGDTLALTGIDRQDCQSPVRLMS